MGPAVTIGIPASVSEQDVAGTLTSLRASAERAALPYEIIIAVNGPGNLAPAEDGVATFAHAIGVAVQYEGAEPHPERTDTTVADAACTASRGGLVALRVLRLTVQSKIAAWNAIRSAARAPTIVFADADVRVAPGAVGALTRRLTTDPALAVAAGREVARLELGDGVVARVAALPYRFDFGNVPGRLYALRVAALPGTMPPVVAEDGYLTVRLGRHRLAKEPEAVVYLRPPTTWRDYLRQRVRHEVGKLQLRHEFPDLYQRHGFGRSPWRAFVRDIAAREYPLVALALAVRVYARVIARQELRHGVSTGWAVLPSTKRWSFDGGAAPGHSFGGAPEAGGRPMAGG